MKNANTYSPGRENAVAGGDSSHGTATTLPRRKCCPCKQSWGVIVASAAIGPIWWLFVFWIPVYLSEVYAMDVKTIGIYGAGVPYVRRCWGPGLAVAGAKPD